MKALKKGQTDPYALNRQLENAYIWLFTNHYIMSKTHLAQVWGISRSTATECLNMTRHLGEGNASKFDKNVLAKHKLTLEQFKSDVLVRQAKSTHKPKQQDIASLQTTQLVRLEALQELILDKIADLEIKIGELRELVTK